MVFLSVDEKKFDKLKLGITLGKVACYRVEFPNLFKSEKILYLDVDLVILGDIIDLFKIDLKKKTIGAIKDYVIGLENKEEYFNSGVMVIDCKQWNKNNYSKKFFEYEKKHKGKFPFLDQDILNEILKNDWLNLPLEWNRQRILLDNPKKKFNLPNGMFLKLRDNPKIIHYTGKIKPWHYRYVFPDKKYYSYYLKKCKIKEEYVDKNLKNFIYKMLRYVVYKLNLRFYLEKTNLIPKEWR